MNPPPNADNKQGRDDALTYAINLAHSRKVGLKRLPAYIAAIDEMIVFLEAAKERNAAGEQMESVAFVQQPKQESPAARHYRA